MPSPHQIYIVLLLVGSLHALFFSIMLQVVDRKKVFYNNYLSVAILIAGIHLFLHFLVESKYILSMTFLTGASLPLSSAWGPLLYGYIKKLTSREQINAPDNTIKYGLGSVLIISLVLIPFWQLDGDVKVAMAINGYSVSGVEDSVFYAIFLMVAFTIVTLSVSVFKCFKLLRIHRKLIKNLFSQYENVSLNWLRGLLYLVGITAGLFAWYVMVSVNEDLSRQFVVFVTIVIMLAIFYVGIMGLLQPHIYHEYYSPSDPCLKTERKANQGMNPDEQPTLKLTDATQECAPKYSKSSLTADEKQLIANNLTAIMETEKLFLEPDISLSCLSSRLSISVHYLSQTLNEELELSFFDFISKFRVNHAIQLLKEQRIEKLSIAAVMYDSGFNSKSSFYRAFKKHVGMTPSEFLSKECETLPAH